MTVIFRPTEDRDDGGEELYAVDLAIVPDVGDVVSFLSNARQPTAGRVVSRHWNLSRGSDHVIVRIG